MAITITLNGVDMTSSLQFKTLRLQKSREVAGSTLQFSMWLYDLSVAKPEEGMEVIFTDGSTREFGGTLLRLDIRMGEANRLIMFSCECVGYSYLLDRRLLNKIYTSKAAGSMIGEILDDLENAADGEGGDAHYTDFQGDKTKIATTSPTIRQQRFERVLPTQAMQSIAEASGMFFSMTANKQVRLSGLEADPALLPLEDGIPILDIDSNLSNFYNMTVSLDISGVGSKVILQSAIVRSSILRTDPFIWTTGRSYAFELSRRPFSDLDITSVKANSVTLTRKLQDVDETLSSGEYMLFLGSRSQNKATVEIHPSNITNGQAVEVIYNYALEDDHENIDPSIIAELARKTGGDGYHEFVYSRASELAVVNPVDLDEISETILARKAKILFTGQFSSLTKGWDAGQYFFLRWPRLAIDEEVYAIAVQKIIRTPANDPTLGDNIIESTVMFSNIPRGVRL